MEKLRSGKWINCFSRKERVVESWGEVKRDKILCVRFLSFFSFSAGEKERILSIFSGSSGSTNALRSSRYTGHGSINFNVY